MILSSGKINIIIDGQFGSTGKGLLSSYVSVNNKVDIAVSNCSANAGHTFYYKGSKYIVSSIPVSSIINEHSIIYISAGAVLNVDKFFKELKMYDIDMSRVFINPNTCIITNDDINDEKDVDGPFTKIASTRSGVGAALSRKIRREGNLAKDDSRLKKFIYKLDLQKLVKDRVVLVETSQGLGLSLNSGYEYPYCTSREITVSSTLADIQVHPKFLGKVCACIRTFPIRVGNIVNNGVIVGDSGPFYDDSYETNWDSIGVTPEYTTVTKRKRRVATFSVIQYKEMLQVLQPDYILLNFCNYLEKYDLIKLLRKLPEVTHLGFGKYISKVYRRHEYEKC